MIDRDRSTGLNDFQNGATKYAVRGATSLTVLNGAAAIALLVILGLLPEAGGERAARVSDEIMSFGWGAAAGALCFLLGWITQIIRAEGPMALMGASTRRSDSNLDRLPLLRILRLVGLVAGIVSAALFLVGLRGSASDLSPKLPTVSAPASTAPTTPGSGSGDRR